MRMPLCTCLNRRQVRPVRALGPHPLGPGPGHMHGAPAGAFLPYSPASVRSELLPGAQQGVLACMRVNLRWRDSDLSALMSLQGRRYTPTQMDS